MLVTPSLCRLPVTDLRRCGLTSLANTMPLFLIKEAMYVVLPPAGSQKNEPVLSENTFFSVFPLRLFQGVKQSFPSGCEWEPCPLQYCGVCLPGCSHSGSAVLSMVRVELFECRGLV